MSAPIDEARLHLTNLLGLIDMHREHGIHSVPIVTAEVTRMAREWLAANGGPSHEVHTTIPDPQKGPSA